MKGDPIMALPTRVRRGQGLEGFDPAREFENALGRFFYGGRGELGGDFGMYPVDVREDGDHVYIEAELPGFKKEDVDITFENNTLTISAERKEEHKEGDGNGGKKGDLVLQERRYTRFLRSFTLPPTVSPDKVDAKLQDGVLNITLDKREETKPRKIQVS
jgi:HSP20 family protein